jgi:histidinol-phosphate/aromatic aminotransferase/cobyric acid decarboxylase-like protein
VSNKAFHGGASFQAIGVDLQHLENREGVIDADVLDSWYPPSPSIVRAIEPHLEWLIKTSPPTHGDGLRQAIAESRGVDPDHILIGAGSSALMFLLFPQLLNVESNVTILDPMYGEYAHLVQHVVGATLHRCPLDEALQFAPQLHDVVDSAKGSDMLILVNPNSPTGYGVGAEYIQSLLEALEPNTKVWIDETYIDFMPGAQSAEPLVERFPNLIVSKSMSKYYGLSGLRLGYVVASPAITRRAELFSPPWSVGLMAQLAGIEALKASDYYQSMAIETHRLRQDMAAQLAGIMGVTVFDSVTNYLMFATEQPLAATIVESAKQSGIYLRNCDSLSPRFQGRFVRTAVKTERQNHQIIQAIAQAIQG